MNKKKLFSASLASVAVLGASFLAAQTSVVKADDKVDTSTTPSTLNIFDIVNSDIVNSGAPAADKPVAKPAPAAKPADKPVNEPALVGVTVLKPVAKPKELAALETSPAELAARAEFLANFDKALAEQIKKIEAAKPESTDPEAVKAAEEGKAKVIAKLKEEAAATRAEIVAAFANGVTVKDAEKFLEKPAKTKQGKFDQGTGLTSDDISKMIEADIAAEDKYTGPRTEWVTDEGVVIVPVAGVDKDDPLYNSSEKDADGVVRNYASYDARLKAEGYEFVKTETKDGVTRHYYEATIAKKTLWVDEEGKTLFAADGFQDENFQGNHEKLDKEGYDFVTVEQFDDEGETVVYFVYKKGTSRKGDSLVQPELQPYAEKGPSLVQPELPEYKPATPSVAGTNKDNTYKAPAAKEEAKKEEAKKEEAKKEEAKKALPNTGTKENAALASVGFLGLVLGALPFAKRKN